MILFILFYIGYLLVNVEYTSLKKNQNNYEWRK